MKRNLLVLFLLLLLPISAIAQDQTNSSTEESDPLRGIWKIDLRPTPESEAYFQTFEVKMTDGQVLTGTFYNSEIKDGLINRNWPKIYFAFSTSDQNSEYYHSGYLENGKLYGITYCPNRNFAAPWTGSKE